MKVKRLKGNHTGTLEPQTGQQILFIRKELMKEDDQIGAIYIQYEYGGMASACSCYLDNQPHHRKVWIEQATSVHKMPKDCPELFWHTHQMDLVSPRYIKSDTVSL